MRGLLDLDVVQLKRIDDAIAAFKAAPAAERQKKTYILRALEQGRRELLEANPAIKLLRRLQSAG